MNIPNRRFLGVSIALVAVTDFLLWPAKWGLSFGLWIGALILALSCCRPFAAWRGRPIILAALLSATALQSMVEISFSNGLVAFALLMGLVGETAFPMLPRGWARCSEACYALLKAPGRWFWVNEVVSEAASGRNGVSAKVMRWVQIAFPAVVVCGLFSLLFTSGNAIFGRWVELLFAGIRDFIAQFDLSLGHLLFYGFFATFALAVLRPAFPGDAPRFWTRTLPFLPESNESIAWWRSAVLLGALNVLFFAVNTIDVFYLWTRGQIPPEVSHSQYVHEGVASLTIAVILSALLLTILFQQKRAVSGTRGLKRLGYLWIVQNVILIANVAHRLVSYVEVSQLTPKRIYVGFFLLLVLTGFVLLTIHIARESTLNRLILRSGIATLVLFFTVQFLDVAGWVARFNVARWESGRYSLDVGYLSTLGPSAWPSLLKVAKSKKAEGRIARQLLEAAAGRELGGADSNWRSWQARRAMNLGVLRRFE